MQFERGCIEKCRRYRLACREDTLIEYPYRGLHGRCWIDRWHASTPRDKSRLYARAFHRAAITRYIVQSLFFAIFPTTVRSPCSSFASSASSPSSAVIHRSTRYRTLEKGRCNRYLTARGASLVHPAGSARGSRHYVTGMLEKSNVI